MGTINREHAAVTPLALQPPRSLDPRAQERHDCLRLVRAEFPGDLLNRFPQLHWDLDVHDAAAAGLTLFQVGDAEVGPRGGPVHGGDVPECRISSQLVVKYMGVRVLSYGHCGLALAAGVA